MLCYSGDCDADFGSGPLFARVHSIIAITGFCFVLLIRVVSETLSIDEQNTVIAADSLAYLRSPNYPNTTTADVTAMCAFTAADDSTFRLSTFVATVFLDDVSGDVFEEHALDVNSSTVLGDHFMYELTSENTTDRPLQRLTYSDLINVDLSNVTVMYAQGTNNLSFLMQVRGETG